MPRSFNIAAIFGGVGGFELGLERAGHRTSLFCEIDPEAVSVLAARFPGVPIELDVRKTKRLVSAISAQSDLLTTGFPCTDLSQAGTTQGFAGDQSRLIRDTIRLMQRRPFPNLLIENVPTHSKGWDIAGRIELSTAKLKPVASRFMPDPIASRLL